MNMNMKLKSRISSFTTFRRFAPLAASPELLASEVCDFCSSVLFAQHRHLLEMSNRKIICACDACALRFENANGGRFKLIPREGRALLNFELSQEDWDSLGFPIELVFIYKNGVSGAPMAICPSPAGATESPLPLDNWRTIIAANPDLEDLRPDVEALLINRTCQSRDHFIVPVNVCFELAGLVRRNWRGFSGGRRVWGEIETFFEQLRGRSLQGEARVSEWAGEAVYA